MIWGQTAQEKLWAYKLHAWFAWRPVKLDNGRWVWLQWIWQQKKSNQSHRDDNDWNRETLCKACALRFSCKRSYRDKTTSFRICSYTEKDEPKEKNGA